MEEDDCLMFNNETRPLYVETDSSGRGLEAGLLQIRGRIKLSVRQSTAQRILRPIAFASKSLSPADMRYRYIEKNIRDTTWTTEISALIFAREVSIITDYKPLVANSKKGRATLLQKIQYML